MANKAIYHPPWCNPRKLVIGDTCRIVENGEWIQKVYTGRIWVNRDTAEKYLQDLADKRGKIGRQIIASRKM